MTALLAVLLMQNTTTGMPCWRSMRRSNRHLVSV
jgi:hypothetical protein